MMAIVLPLRRERLQCVCRAMGLQRTEMVFSEASYLLVGSYLNLRASRGCFSHDEMRIKKMFLCLEILILLLPLAPVLKHIECLAYFHLPSRQRVPKVKYAIRSPLINVPFVNTILVLSGI